MSAPKPLSMGDSITLTQTVTVSGRIAKKGKSFTIAEEVKDPDKQVVLGEALTLVEQGKASGKAKAG